jgi:hypothetical protein
MCDSLAVILSRTNDSAACGPLNILHVADGVTLLLGAIIPGGFGVGCISANWCSAWLSWVRQLPTIMLHNSPFANIAVTICLYVFADLLASDELNEVCSDRRVAIFDRIRIDRFARDN